MDHVSTSDLLKEAAKEWYEQKMSADMFAMIAYGLLFPEKPNADDMQWGYEALLRYKRIERGA